MHNLSEVHTRALLLFCGCALTAVTPARGQSPTGASVVLPAITVTAPRDLESRSTDAASERRISGETLNTRPIQRPGEMLEAAPGLVVTQHSGEGKANQYFLRGFNLDHGTDLAITLDGMPVNMRSHGHGQGYADLNFLIPELVDSMLVRKGPYWASEGDFASAGSLHLRYADRLEKNMLSGTAGSFGYWRGLGAASVNLGPGILTGAAEIVRYDGPWQIADATRKYNGFLRYSEGAADKGLAITALAYTNSWHSTDQIPLRAVINGSLDRYAGIDPTDGGDAQRYSLSARWTRSDEKSLSTVEGYFIYQTLNLYNDFTYFLNDPVNGVQFQQSDKRKVLGLNASHTLGTTTLGLQFRHDDINVGLFNTLQRMPLSTIRQDHVVETSLGLYAETRTKWTDWLRSIVGLRGDMYWTSVDLDGAATAFLPSPKAGLVFGPFAATELYLNAGLGFHSNDARGLSQGVPLLVRSRGAEVGARTQAFRGFDSALALFLLELDSELIFVGDAGTTRPGRPSRRIGVEWTNHYRPMAWAVLDLDLSYTRARFTDYDPVGNDIAGSPTFVAAAGLILGQETGWFGGLRWRYFGARPLIEGGSVSSGATSLINARLGYVFDNGLKLQLDGFNILNTQASQIDYFYQSRLRGEATAVNDVHFHPVEPLALRFTVAKAF